MTFQYIESRNREKGNTYVVERKEVNLMKTFEIEFHLVNGEVLTYMVEADTRYEALESIYQSFRHASDGFVQFEDELIVMLDHVTYVKVFEVN